VRPGRAFAEQGLRRLELGVIAAVALFAGASFIAALAVGGAEVGAAIARLEVGTVVLLLLLSLVNYGCRALRWHRFARHIGVAIPFRRMLLYYVAGFALTTTPGKLGEALRLWLIERCHGYRYDRVMPLFVADRVFDMIAVLMLALLGAASFPNQRLLAFAAFAGVVILAIGLARPAWILPAIGWGYAASGRRLPRLFAGTRRAIRGNARLFGGLVLADGLLLSVLGWSAECAAFALLLDAMGHPVGFTPAAFVFAFAASVGAASMAPGGLGGTEATMIALLSVLDVDLGTALAATLVIRATTLWFGVGLGFLVLPAALRLARARAREARA
jgi:uncharacterized membrane protein YbhN (UPF0104 family)